MKHPTPAAAMWTAIIEEWRRSGLSVARFCERRGLLAQSLYAWRRKLSDAGTPPVAVPLRGRFVEALLAAPPVAAGTSQQSSLLLHRYLARRPPQLGQRRVGIDCGFDTEVLSAAVKALEAAA